MRTYLRIATLLGAGGTAFVGAAGMLLAGRMTVEELAAHASHRLGLPTCAYGFVFFCALLIASLAAFTRRLRPHRHA